MKFRNLVAIALMSLTPPVVAAGSAPVHVKEVLSDVLPLDRAYPSRHGPSTQVKLTLGEADEPAELLWIVGIETTLTGADGVTPVSPEHMCNATLSLSRSNRYRQRLPTALLPDAARPRLFGLGQAQMSIALPDGFGVPLPSDQSISITVQVLDHNGVDTAPEIRHRVRVWYMRDDEVDRTPIPLVPRSIGGMQLVDGPDCYPWYSAEEVEAHGYGPGCLDGVSASGKRVVDDGFGRKLTDFWVLPPGRELNRTPVTNVLALPYDTTLHYIAAELHPFAVSLTLRDMTTRETVWEGRATPAEDGVGLAAVDHYASAEGIPLHRDHEYELVSVYDNPTRENHTGMARVLLFLAASDLEEEMLRPSGDTTP